MENSGHKILSGPYSFAQEMWRTKWRKDDYNGSRDEVAECLCNCVTSPSFWVGVVLYLITPFIHLVRCWTNIYRGPTISKIVKAMRMWKAKLPLSWNLPCRRWEDTQ
jgi:hypothetical protein